MYMRNLKNIINTQRTWLRQHSDVHCYLLERGGDVNITLVIYAHLDVKLILLAGVLVGWTRFQTAQIDAKFLQITEHV